MILDIVHFNKLDSIIHAVSSAGGINVTIAGGAVRDSVLEKPIADIDVFYQGTLDETIIESFFGKKDEIKQNTPKPNPADFTGMIEYIAALHKWGQSNTTDELLYDVSFKVNNYQGNTFNFEDMRIQMIGVECVNEHIKNFPCYISRMTYSNGCLSIPKEAIQDASLKIVRFTDDCNTQYQDKITEKYSDYL